MAKTDEQTLNLFKVVQAKKDEIRQAEKKPDWKTNCGFRYNKDSSASTNLQVCADVEELVHILAFLCDRKKGFDEAQKILGTDVTFRWMGFTFEAWASDIKTRVNKVLITDKKKALEILESRLDKVLSPELKAQLELEAISKELGI